MTCGGSSEKCVPFAMAAAAYVYRTSVVYMCILRYSNNADA